MKKKPPAARSIGVEISQAVIDQLDGLPGMELHQGDAVHFLRQFDYAAAERVLIYSDPPYLHNTRTSRHRYQHEYDEDDHRSLLITLRGLTEKGVAVMLSGYPSALYDDLLPGWRTLEFQVMTRGGVRTEKLWMNFETEAAHWATFAGSNFTDRQRIKRKAQRWAENYSALPSAERLAILAALLECEQIQHS